MSRQGFQKIWDKETILNIRERYLAGESQYYIATVFNTSQKTISKIVNLKTYPDIGVPEKYEVRLKMKGNR